VAFVALFVFALQTQILQTHIHGVVPPSDGAAITAAAVPSTHGTLPIGGAPLDCAICHLIAHTGVFFTLSTSPFVPPAKWADVVAPLTLVRTAATFATLNWQSRAPPLL
jgi:hypothetical protein